MNDINSLFQKYSLATYNRVGPVFVKGKGSRLWDDQGNRYLDLFPGWGVSILGHCHPRIVKAVSEQAKQLIHLPNNLFFREQALLAREISRLSFPAKVFFGNSGAEAIEGAIKLSRLYGREKGRYEIITMKDSFHGRTFGAMSATGQDKYKVPFQPVLESFKHVKFNDFSDFKREVNEKTVGVIVELIQGEGGVNVGDYDYIKQIRQYCKENDLLFIVDEVQTGMARTGKIFCFSNYDIIPDIMLLSKGLGAGVPISAIVVGERIAGIIQPGMHASTFGGSPLVSRVALEVFTVIREEKLLANVKKMGSYLMKGLEKLKSKFPVIKELRGMGLMQGMELNCDSFPLFQEALKRKLIINSTHQNVLRIMPALTVTMQELDSGLGILDEIFEQL